MGEDTATTVAESHTLLESDEFSTPPVETRSVYIDSEMSTAPEGIHAIDSGMRPAHTASLTYFNGLSLVVGMQVGSAIFSVPSVVVSKVESPQAAMTVWLVAGILAWTGAASFIELGVSMPYNGGMMEYLRTCYHDIFGFLAAWSLALGLKPLSISVITLIFAEYAWRIMFDGIIPSLWVLKGIAITAVVFITFLNTLGTVVGTGTANFLFLTKLMGVGSIALVGLAISLFPANVTNDAPTHEATLHTRAAVLDGSEPQDQWAFVGACTDAILVAMFTYSGWETLGYVTGELKNPRRNVPFVLHSAMAVVLTLYCSANLAYFVVIPLEEMKKSDSVAFDFGLHAFGRPGALFYTVVVCLSCLGALNAKVFSASRLTQAAVKRLYFPKFLAPVPLGGDPLNVGHIHLDGDDSAGQTWTTRLFRRSHDAKDNLPINAMLMNACVAIIFILTGSFRTLLTVLGLAEQIFAFASVAGIFVLRARRKAANSVSSEPVYQTFILNPIIFCTVIGFVIIRSAIERPLQFLAMAIFEAVGVLLYYSPIWQRFVGRVKADVTLLHAEQS